MGPFPSSQSRRHGSEDRRRILQLLHESATYHASSCWETQMSQWCTSSTKPCGERRKNAMAGPAWGCSGATLIPITFCSIARSEKRAIPSDSQRAMTCPELLTTEELNWHLTSHDLFESSLGIVSSRRTKAAFWYHPVWAQLLSNRRLQYSLEIQRNLQDEAPMRPCHLRRAFRDFGVLHYSHQCIPHHACSP